MTPRPVYALTGSLAFNTPSRAKAAAEALTDLGVQVERTRARLTLEGRELSLGLPLREAAEQATLGRLELTRKTPHERLWLHAGNLLEHRVPHDHPALAARLGDAALRLAFHLNDVRVSPDGAHVALSGDQARPIAVFDATTGEHVTDLNTGRAPRSGLKLGGWSPDSRALFACEDTFDTVYRWDLHTGKRRKRKVSGLDRAHASPAGDVVLVTTQYMSSGGAHVLDAKTLKPITQLTSSRGDRLIRHAAISSSGHIVTASPSGDVCLWDPKGWERTVLLASCDTIRALRFVPGTATLLVLFAGSTGEDALPGRSIALDGGPPAAELELWPYHLSIAPDRSRAVGTSPAAPGELRAFDPITGERHAAILAGAALTTWTPDSQTLFVSTGSAGVRPCDPETMRVREGFEGHVGPITDLAFSPDDARLLSSGWDDLQLLLRAPDTGEVLARHARGGVSFHHIAWSGEHLFVHVGNRGKGHGHLARFDPDTLTLLHERPALRTPGTGLALAPDEALVAWAGPKSRERRSSRAGRVHVAATDDLDAEPRILVFPDARRFPQTLAFSADGTHLACALYDGDALVWRTQALSQEASILNTALERAHALAALPDGTLAIAGQGRAVELWSADGEAITQLPARGLTHGLACSERHLAAAQPEAGRVLLWELDALEAAPRIFPGHAKALAFSHDGALLAAGGRRGGVAIWRVT